MVIKLVNKNFKNGVNLITIAIVDSIIEDMNELKIDEESRQTVIELLERKKKDENIGTKKKKAGKKKVILEKNQCGHINDESKRCGAPMCDKDLRRCWVHLTGDQKAAYRWKKAQGIKE